jgi:hypothetical protein
MTTNLILGPVTFGDFEVPRGITFSGTQRLAVHPLAGGGQVVDVLGWTSGPICWSGMFSGPQAGSRARMLEALCAAGSAIPLMWDDFCFTVLISRFVANYQRAFWIPYGIECVVTEDQIASAVVAAQAILATAVGDLSAAASFGPNMTNAISAVSASGATVMGTLPYAQAQAAVATTQKQITSSMATAAGNISSPAFSTALSAVQQLATLSAAHGYVGRAAVNLANAST